MFFSYKLMEPSIEVVGASIEAVKTSMDSTEASSFLQSLPLASTNIHRLPVTSAKSPYACISYHELQALPPWGQEGRSFPSICIYRIPSVCLGSNGVVGDSKKCFVARGSPGGGTEMPSLTTGLILGGEHRINIIRSSASYPYYIIRLRRRHWDL